MRTKKRINIQNEPAKEEKEKEVGLFSDESTGRFVYFFLGPAFKG